MRASKNVCAPIEDGRPSYVTVTSRVLQVGVWNRPNDTAHPYFDKAYFDTRSSEEIGRVVVLIPCHLKLTLQYLQCRFLVIEQFVDFRSRNSSCAKKRG